MNRLLKDIERVTGKAFDAKRCRRSQRHRPCRQPRPHDRRKHNKVTLGSADRSTTTATHARPVIPAKASVVGVVMGAAVVHSDARSQQRVVLIGKDP